VGRKKKTLVRQPDPPSKWPRWTGFRGKTAWDWMQLFIVPLVLTVLGLSFAIAQQVVANLQQDLQQQRAETRSAQQAQKIENQRAQAERELAAQRAQDERLQAYLDQMSNLLLEKDLRASKEDSEVRTLARVRTLTALESLDPSRKTAVVQFLAEAGLVQSVDGRDPIIGLSGAELSGANLSRANLSGADLRSADLRSANLRSANLSDADLREADLHNTLLSDAFLNDAFLNDADLSDADLSDADLSGAEGITNEELEQQARSLKGATMPNGQKYEDWLKSKDR
jgi:uncharacterized protein YjbI with pentapeptide repeats